MPKISIPNPCSEDWNKMTPTERGAFCAKCQIDVIDFTGKTGNQIKTILIENKGQHLCGHIKKSQIDSLNYDFYAWENQSLRTFQSKFVLACVMVFGMTLFTACNGNQHDEPIEVGMVEYVPTDSLGEYHLSTELKGNIRYDTDHPGCSEDYIENGEILIDGLMEIDDAFFDSIPDED